MTAALVQVRSVASHADLSAVVTGFLRGCALASTSLHPVLQLDLADVVEGGTCRVPHSVRAEQLDLSADTVRRVRQGYGRAMVGDPDAPWLRYAPGYTDSAGRHASLVQLVTAGDAAQLVLPVEKLRKEGAQPPPAPFFGVEDPATPSRMRDCSWEEGDLTPVVVPTPGVQGPEGPEITHAEPSGHLEDLGRAVAPQGPPQQGARGGSDLAWEEGGPGELSPADDSPAFGPRWCDTPFGCDVGEYGRPPSAAEAPELWAEAQAQARRLLREARAAQVLEVRRAYCRPAELARALLHLRALWGGMDPAIRAVRTVVLRLLRQREDAAANHRGVLPGRAVQLFLRPRVVQADWWVDGLERRWSAPGWVPMPDPSEVPGWAPASRAGLYAARGGADPSDRTLWRRRARARRMECAAVDLGDLYSCRLGPLRGPGAVALRAIARRDPDPYVAAVLEDYGPDLVGTLRRWARAAADGSERWLEAVTRLDGLAGGSPPPADAPVGEGELWPV